MSTVWMNELSWVDYQARMANDKPPILLPVGALEQHGPHLPLGTDGLLCQRPWLPMPLPAWAVWWHPRCRMATSPSPSAVAVSIFAAPPAWMRPR